MKDTIATYLPRSIKRAAVTRAAARAASRAARAAARTRAAARGYAYSQGWRQHPAPESGIPTAEPGAINRLDAFFDARTVGRGIVKWRHYFEIYDRHLAKFVGKPSRLLEIGIYAGGSLDMWPEYLGPSAELYGVDIDPYCMSSRRRPSSSATGRPWLLGEVPGRDAVARRHRRRQGAHGRPAACDP